MHDPQTWKCGHCAFIQPLPPRSAYLYDIVLEHIRNHRLDHLIVALNGATDEDLIEMCEDEPHANPQVYEPRPDPVRAEDILKPAFSVTLHGGSDPVREADVTPVLAGIDRLLKADLPRARKEQGI